METQEEELQAEIRHDSTVRLEVVIGILVLIILALGGAVWYLMMHPKLLPTPFSNELHQGTSTPTGEVIPPPSQDRHLDENAAYYEIKAVYPSTTLLKQSAGADADAEAVALMKQYEADSIAQFKKDGNFANLSHDDVQTLGLDQRKYELAISYQVKTSPKTVSYIYTNYADTHGAHPNAYYKTFTFDKATGARLTLADLFVRHTDYTKLLSATARKTLPGIVAARVGVSAKDVDMQMINSGTTADERNFLTWYIDGSNLVLLFPPYQVAAYAAGQIDLKIPFSQLPIAAAYK